MSEPRDDMDTRDVPLSEVYQQLDAHPTTDDARFDTPVSLARLMAWMNTPIDNESNLAAEGALARKQELVEEVEKIAESSTQWKAAGDRLRTILDEWKTIKGVDRKTDDAMWKRFSKARDTFNRRRGSHFAELDRQRATAKERKQDLARQAEELSDSEEWGDTAARYRELMEDAVGHVPDEYEYQVYLCHSSQDKDIVRRVRDQLEANQIRCWFDEGELHGGHSARRGMEQGLRSSRYFLLCASANLLDSPWANREIDAVLHLDVKSRNEPKVLVLKLNEDSVETAIPVLLQGKKWFEYQSPGDFERLVGLLKPSS